MNAGQANELNEIVAEHIRKLGGTQKDLFAFHSSCMIIIVKRLGASEEAFLEHCRKIFRSID